MSPAENGVSSSKKYKVVTWDLDTTGRRLIDEICQVAGHHVGKEDAKDGVDNSFSQYVMPYKSPNPGARRSFGIKVSVIGRYRMLKDVETGRILKTKSEISALQDFIDWLTAIKGNNDGVLLVYHEPSRKVLVPLLIEALKRYTDLLDSFTKVVAGFVNSVAVVEKFADSNKVTSNSLRSLCKTLLNDTSPTTNSAVDRAKVLTNILTEVINLDPSKVAEVATTVDAEVAEVADLKSMLGTQGTLRPIFEGKLKQRRSIRERALTLRKMVAEAGLDYEAFKDFYGKAKGRQVADFIREKVDEADDKDVNELVEMLDNHFVTNPIE